MSSADERQALLPTHQGTSFRRNSQNYGTSAVSSTAALTNSKSQSHGSLRLSVALEQSLTHAISLSWRSISVTVSVPGKKSWFGRESRATEQKLILDNVSGIAKPGSMIAIMGASGAGKSTLLNVLTSRNTTGYSITGDVMLNGCVLKDNAIRNISAYVQQHDIFMGCLTVREQLQLRALLRMNKSMNRAQRLERVEQVIREMGLGKCSSNLIGGHGGTKRSISGGERKRLAFACEALTNPPILFCDEPTSSLDPYMAMNAVKALKKMASGGRVILCTIHQPSSELFALFDQVLLLSRGRIAFSGSMQPAIDFFHKMGYPCPSNFNPADHYILTLGLAPGKEQECMQRGESICNAFTESPEYKAIESEIDLSACQSTHEDNVRLREITGDTRYDSSTFTQLRLLTWRAWVSQYRDSRDATVRVMQTIIIGVMTGFIYLQLDTDQKGVLNICSALYLVILNNAFVSFFSELPLFCAGIPILMRDYGSSLYRVDTFYLSKAFAEVPLFATLAVIYGSISYWLIGFDNDLWKFLLSLIVHVLNAANGVSLAYVVSSVFVDTEVVLSVFAPIFIPFMLFSGLFLNVDSIPDYFIPIEKITWMKYGLEILMTEEWKDVDSIECPDVPDSIDPNISFEEICQSRACAFSDGDMVLDYYSMDKDRVGRDMALMCAIAAGFFILAYIVLYIRVKKFNN